MVCQFSAFRPLTVRKVENMAKRVKEFCANYNGEAIKPGEVMIPFEYTDGDAENCVNMECIKTVRQGGRSFKVIYKAVPEEWAKAGKSALNLIQNEELGHYDVPNSISMDEMRDEYELELGQARSAEDALMEEISLEETLQTFVELVTSLIEKSPKLGYAVLLMHTGVKGEAFYEKVRLTHNPANRLRQQAESILQDGLANCCFEELISYRNANTQYYREEALKLLDNIIQMYR
jgi:hypothetical protein